MKELKVHIYKFDNIKVFLMILVIIAHTLINSYGDKGMEYIRFICLCYTMPLFTFISGYLSKKEQSLKKNCIRLLLPCIIFTIINENGLIRIIYSVGNNRGLLCGICRFCLYIALHYHI